MTLFLFSISPAFSQGTIVVPHPYTRADGDTNNLLPFNCGFFPQFASFRYQQIYAGSQIGKSTIDGVSFRLGRTLVVNPGFPPTTLPGVQINMSTTEAIPGELSDTYADNIGPDDTVVFSGDLTISAPDCASHPCPFVVDVPLQQSFEFDPANGNLLVDFRISDCVNLGDFVNFDATELFPDVTSRASGQDVNSPTGDADDVGLVTQFRGTGFISGTTQPIPTLSEWGMIAAAGGLGLIGVFFAIKRKRARVV
jgi:hypothetical protein